MGVFVNFDYATWIARYPEFGPSGAQPVTAPVAQMYFDEASLYNANDGTGPVTISGTQSMLMNMMTAHIASLNAANSAGAPAPNLVGRISNASEGSVSVGVENDFPPGSPQWFQQTKYGAAWWAATAQYRRMRYVPGPVMGVPANQGSLWSGFGFGSGFPFRGCR